MTSSLRSAVRIPTHIAKRNFASTSRVMAAKPEWLFILPDIEGALDKRWEVRPKHLEAIKTNVSGGVVNMGGAILDEHPKEGESPKVNGSCMLIAADTKEDAMKIIENDIYYKSGVWNPDKIQVLPFKTAVRNSV